MRILKFGGSSLGSPERIRNVVDIVLRSRQPRSPVAIVVSAFQEVTDQLLETGRLASCGDRNWPGSYGKIQKIHTEAAEALFSNARRENALAYVCRLLDDLQGSLRVVFEQESLTAQARDQIMSFGERLSAYILSETFKERGVAAEYIDAREVIRTDEAFGGARVYLEESYENIRRRFAALGGDVLPVITGFIGTTAHGQTTTLGRGGSDYTAAIFGAALEAQEIEIWTDVDGVMTADPRKVEGAFSIQMMTYEEAMEMAHFGAKVIYPPTIRPALQKRIPIRIKNTFNPAFDGTVVGSRPPTKNCFLAKGISSIDRIGLLRVQGSGMIGVAGIAARLFGALARRGLSVILITQASSEHSICFAVDSGAVTQAKGAVEEEFRTEIAWGEIDGVAIEEKVAVVAVVGEKMRKTPGVAAKAFGALGEQGVNVIAIAQGSSELNISIVVALEDERRALNAIHTAFFSQKALQSRSAG